MSVNKYDHVICAPNKIKVVVTIAAGYFPCPLHHLIHLVEVKVRQQWRYYPARLSSPTVCDALCCRSIRSGLHPPLWLGHAVSLSSLCLSPDVHDVWDDSHTSSP